MRRHKLQMLEKNGLRQQQLITTNIPEKRTHTGQYAGGDEGHTCTDGPVYDRGNSSRMECIHIIIYLGRVCSTMPNQLLAYADDVNLLENNIGTIKKKHRNFNWC
jgi:hypothetical protein